MRDDRSDQRATSRSDTTEVKASVVYDWDLATDAITWGTNVGDVLGLDAAHRLSTGMDYADHLAAVSPSSRYEAIMAPGGCDTGGGVPYVAIYGLLSARRSSGPTIWIEDTGRWFADACDRPGRAHGTVRIVTERYEAERQLDAAGLDAATGAVGPAGFIDHVTRQLNGAGQRSGFAVLIIALSPCYLSSPIDDAAIVATVSHLRADMRGHESIARLGADRFAVLLEQCDAVQAASAGERFIARVAEPLAGVPAVRAHVGAVLGPSQGPTADALMRCAESALAVALGPASPPFVLFDPEAVPHVTQDASGGADAIVTAINEGRVCLALQPIVCARTRRPIRYDGRLQIIRRDGSLLLTQANLPLAGGSDIGPLLDRRILDLAFRLLTRDRSLQLSITLTVESLAAPTLVDYLRAACKLRPDAARRLTVGVCERDAVADLDATRRALAVIKPLGVTIAIDDVGAASFHALRVLPIDVLTIDSGLAADDQRLRGLLAVARDLGASVVAKQVHDEATADRLAGRGVAFLQGHVFGRSELPDQTAVPPIAATG